MLSTIRLKNIVSEDFINYKEPSMFLVTCFCDWKCCTEGNFSIRECQNQSLIDTSTITYEIKDIISLYLNNEITKAIIFGGLEPFLQLSELYEFIVEFRKVCNDSIIIYTGYTEEELRITGILDLFKEYKNIIIKYGRYIPNQTPHYDEILGIDLVSDNQYAKQIS